MNEQKEKKKGMSGWGKFGIGCGGLIVLIIIIAVIAGSGSSNKTSSSNNSKQTTTKTEYAIGDTINLRDHQLIVNSVDTNYKSTNQFDTPQKSENVFVAVDVTLINNGKSDLLVNDFGFKLEDETGTQRNSAFIAGIDGQLESVTLSPGGKTSGKLSFEAKKDSSKLILHYDGNGLLGNEITVKLK